MKTSKFNIEVIIVKIILHKTFINMFTISPFKSFRELLMLRLVIFTY